MSDKPETSADIEAAKREIEKLNSVIQATVSRSDAEIDRLRREVAELRKQLGNAAAMRKALEAARDLLLPQCNGGTAFAKACGETVNKIMDALSAPPRNCDLYRTKKEAQEAFLGEACDHPCENCWVEDINNECGVDWLLAPATEKEGGNDAD